MPPSIASPDYPLRRDCIIPPALTCAVVLALVSCHAVAAQGTCQPTIAEAYLDVNNVRARILNNGNLFWRGSPAVYEVPKGGGVSAIYSSSLWLGGLVNGELRTAAARYNFWEYWAGPLDEAGNPPTDCSEFDKIWKIDRDDVETYEASQSPSQDLASWPTGLGAPTLAPAEFDAVDNDRDGQIDESGEMRSITGDVLSLDLTERRDRLIDLEAGERPDLLGDQMLWWIMNDVGSSHESTGSNPIGVEIHATAFAFDAPDIVAGEDPGGAARFYRHNTTYFRYRIRYTGDPALENAYVGIFADLELGDFADDYLATDTARALTYVYNADDDDAGSAGYGDHPPALGYLLLESPAIESPGDTAFVAGSKVPNQRNIGLTSTMQYLDNDPPYSSADYFNVMQAQWYDGTPIREGGDGLSHDDMAPATKFAYPGDPLAGQYWSEVNSDGAGTPNPPFDKRVVMGSGPFSMRPGDTQQIAFAIVWARGADNMDSVAELLAAADSVRDTFSFPVFNVSNRVAEITPSGQLLTNYPNPFAGTTNVRYDVASATMVKLDVFDALGRQVQELVHREMPAGQHEALFNASGLPAGLYIVRLVAGDFSASRAMISVHR